MSEQAATLGVWEDSRTLEQKLSATRENWRPHTELTQPRSISGLVIDLGKRDLGFDQQGETLDVRILADDGQEWVAVGFHAILRAELLRAGPRIGDRIGIAYQGEGRPKENQSPPHLYRVVVERNPEGEQSRDAELPPAPDFTPDSDIPF